MKGTDVSPVECNHRKEDREVKDEVVAAMRSCDSSAARQLGHRAILKHTQHSTAQHSTV